MSSCNMSSFIMKIFIFAALLQQDLVVSYTVGTKASQNKSHYVRRSSSDLFKPSKQLYRSFQPSSSSDKYHKTSYPRAVVPRADDIPGPDYDLTSYDAEYGGVASNFTSSIYDDNPPLYPNPEFISRSNEVIKIPGPKVVEPEVDLPDDSLADADLKEHNIIDSVTYLYGFNNCHSVRNEWIILIFIPNLIAVALLAGAVAWLAWSAPAAEFRRTSKLFPINVNLCCCLAVCALIYMQAVMGASSPAQCERIALLLHYTHLCCAAWIVALASAVAEHCARDHLLPLKYNYLLAYGVPAIVVMFNYALSMEHYETKHYCWMSIEKGMVMGFMVPAMVLIVINTTIVILGLQSLNKKQTELLTTKIQELVDHHIANWPKNESEDVRAGSLETLEAYSPRSSRKNTDSSETVDKESNLSEDPDDCQYIGNLNGDGGECSDNAENFSPKIMHDKGLMSILYNDNLSWKSWGWEGGDLKSYLHLCLVLEPFFAVNWVMGVVAIENATHWSTPAVYLVLIIVMYVYLTVTVCTTLPIVPNNTKTPTPCCEDVVVEPTVIRTRTTDSIPLLDPATVQPASVTPAPADTISTISI